MNEAVLQPGKPSAKIRILLADDHPLMRIALRTILDSQADFEVVGEVEDGEQAVKTAIELVPDIVIMDISMPNLNGLEATRQIKARCPRIAILALTVHSDSEHILGILEAGAAGYLTKKVFGKEVLEAIRSLATGETVLSPEILQQILKHTFKYQTKAVHLDTLGKISAREQEILKLVARGMSNKDIAKQLNISPRTVKTYLVDLFAKMHVASRTEAVITGLKAGLISLNDLD